MIGVSSFNSCRHACGAHPEWYLENSIQILVIVTKFADHCLKFIFIQLDDEEFKRKSRRRRKALHSFGEHTSAAF